MAEPDAHDLLGFLRDHEGEDAKVEIGVRASDLENHDLPYAKLYGKLGPWRLVDDEDRPGRGVAWVPIGPQEYGSVGSYVEADQAQRVRADSDGAQIRFGDGHYVTIITFDR